MKSRTAIFFCLLLSACVYHDLHVDEPSPFVCVPEEISWQEDILPIMQASCATTGCHDGISRRDWTDYDEVKEYATSIKSKTVDRSMPFDGPLPQEQIDMIACWVDGGALNN
jgi:hypothetical protein